MPSTRGFPLWPQPSSTLLESTRRSQTPFFLLQTRVHTRSKAWCCCRIAETEQPILHRQKHQALTGLASPEEYSTAV
ncbi:MAG: hypothetical protein ACK55Z_29170, partial [bacterium]